MHVWVPFGTDPEDLQLQEKHTIHTQTSFSYSHIRNKADEDIFYLKKDTLV